VDKLRDPPLRIVRVLFDSDTNIFTYAENCEMIQNIFELITPNDLYLYRFKLQHNLCSYMFKHRYSVKTLCEFIHLYSITKVNTKPTYI
jgi:hypothetical protein